jgi:hypothetical protein
MTVQLSGRCCCGAVQFEVEDAFSSAFYCHCSKCRRSTGSAFTALARIEADKVRVRSGGEHVLALTHSGCSYGQVCRHCCSPLFTYVQQRQFVHMPLGVLSEAPSRRPDHHIYVGSKAPWHEISDDLPRHHELPHH